MNIYSAKPAVELLVGRLQHSDSIDVVISPGSRNAPFIQSFVAKPNHFKTYSVVDERSAGFFALGIALAKQKPVVLVCTSGSAVLNYYPAVAEAFYQQIPLIILSADRPKKNIDNGQGQTIRQEHVLSNHVCSELSLDGDTQDVEALKQLEYQIFEHIENCKTQKSPIHLNVHLDEPLYEMQNQFEFPFSSIRQTPKVEFPDFNDALNIWKTASKKLIIVGQQQLNTSLESTLNQLVEQQDVLVLSESTSNLKLNKQIHTIDVFLTALEENEALKSNFFPDVIIQLGGAIVSKKIKFLFQKNKIEHNWSFQASGKHPDVFFSLTKTFNADFELFAKKFSEEKRIESDYSKTYLAFTETLHQKAESFFEKLDFSDLYVYNKIIKTLDKDTVIHSSNSSVIRYLQLFKDFPFSCYCNRGTSGIDGSTSTAIGFSSQFPDQKQLLITGDISFFYDSNALWNNYISSNFKIILINNAGGEIFRIIPGPKDSFAREDYFSTTHQLRAKGIAETFGIEYYFCNSEADFESQFKAFLDEPKTAILELKTPPEKGAKTLEHFFQHLRT
ncbi:MAG: 2-succinyl-5-enolpyruvyl-6-hydroxy-3-cyclohexene-1-carboxylic-acid synthase [Flavobacteriales bacterium]